MDENVDIKVSLESLTTHDHNGVYHLFTNQKVLESYPVKPIAHKYNTTDFIIKITTNGCWSWKITEVNDPKRFLGICSSELNGWFNPKENQQQALMKLDLVKGSKKYDRDELYKIRTTLVKAIDPLRSEGADLQEILLKCNRMAMGEISSKRMQMASPAGLMKISM